MKVRSMVLAGALGAISLLVVVGCGGGSSSSSSADSGSSGAGDSSGSFVSGADAACAGANEQIAALGTPQQAQVLVYMEKTETVIENLDDEVRAVVGSGAAEVAYSEALGKAVIVLNQMANAARNENFDAVRELSNGLVELHLGELAEKAGLKVCAEVPVNS